MRNHKERASSRRRQQQITTLLFISGAGLVLLALAVLLIRNPAPQVAGPAKIGAALGNFSLKDIHGATVQLSDFAGKTVLVNAWATWCPPCKAEMPDLNTYYQAHQDEGFVILAINAGDPVGDAAAFAEQNRLAFPVLVDPNTALLDSMRINSFPTSILVGSDGLVKSIHIGMFTPETLEQEITPYLLK